MNENFTTIIFTSLSALLVSIIAIFVEHFIIVPLRENQKRKQGRSVSRKEKTEIFTSERLKGGFRNVGRSSFYWVLFIAIILFFIFFAQYYKNFVLWLSNKGIIFPDFFGSFVAVEDYTFYLNFIGYISVLLGFFLPIILLRVWEQFDAIDREFDREAEAVTIFFEDVLLLDNQNFGSFKARILNLLLAYTQHVRVQYKHEHEGLNLLRKGNEILSIVRSEFKNIIYSGGGKSHQRLESILNELIYQLNLVIEIRKSRISLSRKRLFASLKFILIITSVVWIMPFYVISYVGVFAYLLVFILTFLVIFILTVIDDLDDPFNGTWSIFIDSWKELSVEIQSTIENQLPVEFQQVHREKT